MALINCPECEKEVSDSAKKCLHCGYRLKPPFNWIPLGVIAAIFIVFGLGWSYSNYKERMERWERDRDFKSSSVNFYSALSEADRKLQGTNMWAGRSSSDDIRDSYKESKQELKDVENNKPRWLFW